MSLRDALTLWMRGRAVRALLALGAMVLVVGTFSAPVSAESLGELERWGSPPPGEPSDPLDPERPADQLFRPSAFGVDPVDGSVYVLDQRERAPFQFFRLAKFSASGTLLASVEIPRPPIGPEEELPQLNGIAVDHALGRIYLVQSYGGLDPTHPTEGVAQKVLVYSTDDSTGTLHAPTDLPSGELPLPAPPSSNALEQVAAVAIDPSTHDLLILAEGIGNPNSTAVVARFSETGAELDRFTDSTGAILKPGGMQLRLHGMAVAPDGQDVYISTGEVNQPVRVFELPASLDGFTPLDGTEGNPKVESPHYADTTGGTVEESGPAKGPLLAISPDGEVLYFNELWTSVGGVESPYAVRGVSLRDGSTRVLYGGAASGPCSVTAKNASPAVEQGGEVFVLDRGPGQSDQEIPTLGDTVLRFGAGGSGCPGPTASLEVDGSSEPTVTVQKGDSVSLDASGSELQSFAPTEASWTASGPEPLAETLSGSPPAMSLGRRFLEAGTYTLDFEMKVTPQTFQDVWWSAPPKTLIVEGATPTASFSAPGSALSGVAAAFDAEGSEDPTGGECSQADGCKPSTGAEPGGLKSYHWDFGDGTTEETSEPTAEHTFVNETAGPVQRTVTLTVTSNDDVESAPTTKQVTVQPATANPTLIVAKAGDGTSTVTSSPAGIECGDDCEGEFESGEVVTLTVAPGPHSTFAGWSSTGDAGTCTGTTSPCQLTMSESKALTAKSDLKKQMLTVTRSGTGAGSVSSAAPGIGCPSDCEAEFEEGSEVTLTPKAASGSKFDKWTGCDKVTGTACEVTMSAAKAVDASFVVAPPTVVNMPEEAVGQTSASLAGKVNDNGVAGGAQCSFQVALASDTGFSSPVASPKCVPEKVTGESDTAVFATVTGLSSGTAYIYRVKATSAGGTAFGSPAEAFTTQSEPPPPPPPSGGSEPAPAPAPSPEPSSGGNRRKALLAKRKAALARCRKLKGKARTRCMRKARQIGKPRHRVSRRRLERWDLPFGSW
jgi:hypothetical protein